MECRERESGKIGNKSGGTDGLHCSAQCTVVHSGADVVRESLKMQESAAMEFYLLHLSNQQSS